MKILASDFDGTIFIDKKIKKEDIKAIRDFQNNGNLFGIVTGRTFHILDKLIKDNINPDFIIANNGGHILVNNGNCYKQIYKKTITYENARALFYEIKQKYGYEVTIFTDNSKFVNPNLIKDDILALAIYTNIHIPNPCADIFEFHYSIGVIDVVYAGTDKQKGINIVKQHYNYKDDIIAIGDDYNDIVFLKQTPLSYTLDYVENEKVRNICNYSVKSIAELIEKEENI